jgi:hypothetical protein
VKRAWHAFWAFWYDFLVGDAPEFLFVTIGVVVMAYLLHAHRVAGVIVLPVVVASAVAISAWRVRRR